MTTSATDEHLDVLWAEINGFLLSSKHPLISSRGGPFEVTHHKIRMAGTDDKDEAHLQDLKSYVYGKVAKNTTNGEGLAGHHAEETLAVGDEASALSEVVDKMFQGWTSGGRYKRRLYIGNCNPCSTFFFRDVKAGDLVA